MSRCACPTPARRPARRSRCSCRRPIRPGSTTTPSEVAAAVAKVPGRHRPLRRPAAARRRLGARGRPLARRRSTASRPTSVGTVVQLVTTGLKLTDYRPAGADDAVDIRLRLPEDRRTLSTLDQLRIETAAGLGADLQLRHRASRNRRSASSTASTASAPSPSRPTSRAASRSRRCRPRSARPSATWRSPASTGSWRAPTRTAPRPAPSWATPSARRSS